MLFFFFPLFQGYASLYFMNVFFCLWLIHQHSLFLYYFSFRHFTLLLLPKPCNFLCSSFYSLKALSSPWFAQSNVSSFVLVKACLSFYIFLYLIATRAVIFNIYSLLCGLPYFLLASSCDFLYFNY